MSTSAAPTLARVLAHLDPLVVAPPPRRTRLPVRAAPRAAPVAVPVRAPLSVPALLRAPTLFGAWLEKAENDGRRFPWLPSPTGCPLACFVREAGHQPFVLAGATHLYWGSHVAWPAQHMELPGWARAFILLWDSLMLSPLPPSAGWARRVLRAQLWAARTGRVRRRAGPAAPAAARG